MRYVMYLNASTRGSQVRIPIHICRHFNVFFFPRGFRTDMMKIVCVFPVVTSEPSEVQTSLFVVGCRSKWQVIRTPEGRGALRSPEIFRGERCPKIFVGLQRSSAATEHEVIESQRQHGRNCEENNPCLCWEMNSVCRVIQRKALRVLNRNILCSFSQ